MRSGRASAYLWLAVGVFGLLALGLTLWPLLLGGFDMTSLALMAVPRDPAALAAATLPPGAARVDGLIVALSVPRWIGLLTWVGLVAWSVAAIGIAFMMYRLFAELDSAGVFHARNAVRLRRSGWLLIVAELLRIAATMTQDLYARRLLGGDEGPWFFASFSDRDVHLIFGGLVLLGLARAFRIGIRLREDAELTI